MLRFGFIGDLLRWLLDTIYNLIPNYGIAILIFVLIIRMLLMPFEVKSRRGMKKMAELQPKMAELEKKYAKEFRARHRKWLPRFIAPHVSCFIAAWKFRGFGSAVKEIGVYFKDTKKRKKREKKIEGSKGDSTK